MAYFCLRCRIDEITTRYNRAVARAIYKCKIQILIVILNLFQGLIIN